MYVYRCEDSLESIFTAIYNVYENRHWGEEILLAVDDEPRLFAVEIAIEPNEEKCNKVIRTICSRFGEENYRSLCLALSSPDMEKAQAVYRTVAWGLASGCGWGHLFDNLADVHVNKAFKLARSADREYCHLRGFSRFQELESGLLYSKIEPRNDVLAFLMPHFADRFPEENFVLHDVGRDLFGIHRAEQYLNESETNWHLLHGKDFVPENVTLSADEIKYRKLFKSFCQSIAIDARENKELQQNMLPLHFREFMTEFQ